MENKYGLGGISLSHDIVIITGSFNPPHTCHFNLAFCILQTYKNIEKAIFIPVGNHYVKNDLQDAEYRFNMLKACCDTDSRLSVSRIEIDNPQQLYTYETLGIIQSRYPNSKIHLVIGSDNLYQFDTWKKYEDILTKYHVIVFARDNNNLRDFVATNHNLSKYSGSFSYMQDESFYGVNSTVIRALLKSKSDVRALLPLEVYNFIMHDNRYV